MCPGCGKRGSSTAQAARRITAKDPGEKLVHRRLTVLQLAEQLGNVTAPTIHAGFTDEIQLEMFDFRPHDIILDEGMKIYQLIFEQTVGTPDKDYSGMFAGQRASTADP